MRDAAERASGPVDPGRRYLTLLFSDLTDSTRYAAAMEAENYAAMLATVRRAYQETIQRHGGIVVRVQGDGLLAMFGYPEAREDDGRRAVEAALDLHQVVGKLSPDLPPASGRSLNLHTGIHSGLVLVEAGDIERGRYELLGPVPNIAARLSDVAEAQEILVSEETLGPAAHLFKTDEVRPLVVKGRETPIPVFRVQERASAATRLEARTRRIYAPFVGRQAELAALEHCLHEAMEGHPRLAVVSAPAGIGKTRLTEEFLRWAAQRNCQILRGYCENYLSAEPLQPFLQIMRALFGLRDGTPVADAADFVDTALTEIDLLLRSHRGEYLRALSLGGDLPEKHRPAPEATVAALRDLFASLSARRPLVVFIDDWQWADDASNQVLIAIRALAQRAVLIVLATRGFGDGVAPADTRVIELSPFTPSEAVETIGQLLPNADPFVATEIREHSGGNALFIEELCHSVAHDAGVRRLGRMQRGAAWLNQLVESRVGRLPAEQAEVVRAAAVIGNVIPSWLLERITGYREDDPLVRGLAEQDFLFPGERAGTLRFKHGIARDVIYDSVGLHTRRAMHLRIAESLQQQSAEAAREEAYEALAYHFAAGGNAMQAAHYAELAGDKALAASAIDRAQTQYRAALAALDQLVPTIDRSRRWVSIAQRLGLVCVFDASRSDLQIFERAVTVAHEIGDPAAAARAKYWLGYITYSLGDARGAIEHLEQALAEAQRIGENPLAVQILAALGEAHTAACSYDRALELLDEAIAVKRRHRSGKRTNVGLAFSLVCRACVLGDRGEFARAHECFDDALACVVGTHEIATTIHGWHSAVWLWQGRWQDARVAAEESARIADLTRSLFQLSIARAMGGYASWMLERQPASLQAISEATAWLEPREGGLFRSLNYGWLAEGLFAMGRATEARHFAARALVRARKRDLIGVAMAYRALASAAAGERAYGAAERYIALAAKIAGARGSAHELAVTRLCDARIAFAREDRARVATLLDQVLPAFESMGMQWHLAEAAQLAALSASRAR